MDPSPLALFLSRLRPITLLPQDRANRRACRGPTLLRALFVSCGSTSRRLPAICTTDSTSRVETEGGNLESSPPPNASPAVHHFCLLLFSIRLRREEWSTSPPDLSSRSVP